MARCRCRDKWEKTALQLLRSLCVRSYQTYRQWDSALTWQVWNECWEAVAS